MGMKTIFNGIWVFFCAVGKARYAAELARAHKYAEARAVIEK
jgi:hypothetical protein